MKTVFRNLLIFPTRFILVMLSFSLMSSPLLARNQGSKELLSNSFYCFIENKGQIVDQYDRQRNDIDFKAELPGVRLFVGNGQLHFQWHKYQNLDSNGEKMPFDVNVECYRMDVSLLNANPDAAILADCGTRYYETYYGPGLADGHLAKAYQKVTYKNIYNAIDWVLYFTDHQFKYEFVVHPGGNPADILMRYEGAESLLLENGELLAKTPFGAIRDHQLYCYELESKQEINSSFILDGNDVTFSLAQYNGTLVIDPWLEWATYYGGNGPDVVTGLTSDSLSNVYASGYTVSWYNIATSGAHKTTSNGQYFDGFVVKFDSIGNRQWGTYYGGTADDMFKSIAYDNHSNILVAGTTASTTDISTSGAHQQNHGGGPVNVLPQEVFLVKFNDSGMRQWATYYGGTGIEDGRVYCDQSGATYLYGWTESTNNIATVSAYQDTFSGVRDGYIAKFTSSGNRVWATYYGGQQLDEIGSLTVDSAKSIYFCGFTRSASGISTSNVFKDTLDSNGDGFLVKLDSNGIRQWGTYYGGAGEDIANAVEYDRSFLYIGGTTSSSSKIASQGAFQSALTGAYDAFLAKFTSNGQIVWGTYLGGTGSEDITYSGIVANNLGSLYLFGRTESNSGIATTGGYQTIYGGGTTDAYLAKFDTAGNRQWGTYYGGPSLEFANSMVLGNNQKKIFIGGASNSNNMATHGAHQNLKYGTTAGYIGCFIDDTMGYINRPFTDTLLCPGDSISIKYSTTYKFHSNNTFLVQISDSSGSFVNSTTIGSINSDSSGTIKCHIPHNQAPGNKYHIRIVSTAPAREAHELVNIRIKPKPASVVCTNNGPLCKSDTLRLLSGSSSSPVQFKWTGPGFTSNTQNPIIAIVDSGEIGFYYVEIDLNGCKTIDSTYVTVNYPPAKPISFSNSPLCVGETLYLYDSLVLTKDTNTINHWRGPNSYTSSLDTPKITSISSVDSGYYFVYASRYGCVSDTDSTRIIVNNLVVPTANITVSPGLSVGPWAQMKFTVQKTNGGIKPYYQWRRNGADIPGENDSIYYAVMNQDVFGEDKICVIMASNDMCANPDTALGCTPPLIHNLKVRDGSMSNDILIYPIPNKGTFNIGLPYDIEQCVCEIINSNGQIVHQRGYSTANRTILIDTSLPVGAYLLKLSFDNRVYNKIILIGGE